MIRIRDLVSPTHNRVSSDPNPKQVLKLVKLVDETTPKKKKEYNFDIIKGCV